MSSPRRIAVAYLGIINVQQWRKCEEEACEAYLCT
jgi:hypothetical protein